MNQKVCPECGHVFQGNGWDGIDAHWKSKHGKVMPYAEAWPLIQDGTYVKASADTSVADLDEARPISDCRSESEVAAATEARSEAADTILADAGNAMARAADAVVGLSGKLAEMTQSERLARDTARYEALAREHGADLSEEGFDAALKKVARHKPV